MSINTRNITNTKQYQDLRYEFIRLFEEGGHEKKDIYNDGSGYPTIGVGFNLSVEASLDAVLEFGFGISNQATRGGYINTLLPVITAAHGKSNSDMQLDLDRAWMNLTGQSSFTIIDTTNGKNALEKIRDIFDVLADDKEIELSNVFNNAAINPINNSYERLALLSLYYNSPGLIGSNLKNALQNGERFEAWYEIRYNSNNGSHRNGIAKRRYAEAELFGLFSGSTASTQEAQQAVDGFLANLATIQTYEDNFHPQIHEANLNLASSSLFAGIQVSTVGEVLKPATGYILERFNTKDGSIDLTQFANTIDGEVMLGITNAFGEIASSQKGNLTSDKNDLLVAQESTSSTLVGGYGDDILIGSDKSDTLEGGDDNDILIGNEGVDTLKGGKGEDFLNGGTGNDTMIGGDDNDTYYVDSLQDVVTEKAGEGDKDTLISSIDFTVTGQHNNIEIFELDDRVGTTAISLTGNELDNTLKGNHLGNTLKGGNGADTLYGGKGNDRLEAGDEDIYGEGKLNTLYGEDDNDTLVGGDGIDTLYGGEGNDSLWVGRGAVNASSPTEGFIIGTEFMIGGAGFDSYYISNAANSNVIIDSDGQGEIFASASGIGDETYQLTGGTYRGEQVIIDTGRSADGYTQVHADGTTSNYTLAYEADGSKTLIAYGFNIYNFENGMLGINLVGGRVNDNNIPVDSVFSKLKIGSDFDTVEKERIRIALLNIYNKSDTFKAKVAEFVANGQTINISPFVLGAPNDSANVGNTFESELSQKSDWLSGLPTDTTNGASAFINNTSGSPTINIDLSWLQENSYISTTGKAVADTLETYLVHELVKLMDGTSDTTTPGEQGETVESANVIYREMGLAERSSYLAYDATGNIHVTNFDYTGGERVDRAFTLHSENTGTDNFDSASGGKLNDLIIGNERENTLSGGDGRDFLYGNDGGDRLYGNNDNDVLHGDGGDDYLYGEDGDDTLVGGAGADSINGGEGSDTVDYSDSYDSVGVYLASNRALGGDANGDTLTSIENIIGSSFRDYLYGDGQDNVIRGGAGSDIIKGENGNDILEGGADRDRLYGGVGNDTYIYNFGDGEDIFSDTSGVDEIAFGEGITADNIIITHDYRENDWIIYIKDNYGDLTGDQITVENAFADDLAKIERITFSDGTYIDQEEIVAQSQRSNSNFSNVYYFSWADPHIVIKEGQSMGFDVLVLDDDLNPESVHFTRSGEDLLISVQTKQAFTIENYFAYLDEADYDPEFEATLLDPENIIGSSWTIERFEIADSLFYGAEYPNGYERVEPILGSYTNDVINGTHDDDTIDGGQGNDQLYGKGGDDTYRFGVSSGVDTISDNQGSNTVKFSKGITADNLNISLGDNGIDWVVHLLDSNGIATGDSIHIVNTLGAANANNSNNKLFTEVLLESGELDERFFNNKRWIENTANTTIFSIESFEFFDGSRLTAEEIQALAAPVEVGLELEGTTADDELVGGSGNDTINGNAGNDVLIGNLGDDLLDGGAGNDTYVYNLGDGNDIIKDFGRYDTIRLGTGITPDNISLTANDTDMIMTLPNGEVVTILNWFNQIIGSFEFSDGTMWDYKEILANMVVVGDEGNSNIDHWRLYSGTTYDLGSGDDSVYGGRGDDVYIYNLGDGSDTIRDLLGNDVLRFGTGITAENITITATDKEMLVHLPDGNVITIVDRSRGSSSQFLHIEQFEFADGTVWTGEDIFANMVIQGNEGDSSVTLSWTHSYDATFEMGLGDDFASAGWGSDTYIYNLGDGNDTIKDFGHNSNSIDKLVFGDGISTANISLTTTATDLIVNIEHPDTGEVSTITLSRAMELDSYKIEEMHFADGTVISGDWLTALPVTQTNAVDDSSIQFNQLIQAISSFNDEDDVDLSMEKRGAYIGHPVDESLM